MERAKYELIVIMPKYTLEVRLVDMRTIQQGWVGPGQYQEGVEPDVDSVGN